MVNPSRNHPQHDHLVGGITYLISRGMKSMFSDDSARVGTYDTFYWYGTVGYGTVGTVGTVRWVRYSGYPLYPLYSGYPLYPLYRTHRTHRTVPTVPTVPYPPYRTHCTHRTVPPYPTYRTLHRTIIFEDRTPPQSITLEI